MVTVDGVYNEDLDKDYAKIWCDYTDVSEVL